MNADEESRRRRRRHGVGTWVRSQLGHGRAHPRHRTAGWLRPRAPSASSVSGMTDFTPSSAARRSSRRLGDTSLGRLLQPGGRRRKIMAPTFAETVFAMAGMKRRAPGRIRPSSTTRMGSAWILDSRTMEIGRPSNCRWRTPQHPLGASKTRWSGSMQSSRRRDGRPRRQLHAGLRTLNNEQPPCVDARDAPRLG